MDYFHIEDGEIDENHKPRESGGVDISRLTRVDVQQYIYALEQKGNTASTIENKFAALSVLARYLDASHALRNIRRPEVRKSRYIVPKSLDRNEENRVLREVESTRNQRSIAIVYLFLYGGVRVSEMVALDRDDAVMGERSGSIRIRKGKGNISRTVPLPAEARLQLRQYLESRTDDDPALFLSNYRRRISVRSVQRVLENFGVHPHQLRHTYCRELVGAGVDIATVAELAGHADINITRRYAKPNAWELEQAVEKAFNS
ncbi:tyrosine-type recombinase/integrase (plasmid) [Alicyclobacillus curvatus]|nr:tyrosine-type recombinase/integrase [Alicyclobacillus curvatus]